MTETALPAASLHHWTRDQRLAAWHYTILIGIYFFYGYQVCPFLEQLSPIALLLPVILLLLGQFSLREMAKRYFADIPLHRRVRVLFWCDFAAFGFSGIMLSLFNLIVFDFPLESGGKVLVGFLSMGFYIALDLALDREHRLSKELALTGRSFPISPRFMPYQHKFALFSAVNLAILATVCVLVVYKDLHWIAETKPDMARAQYIILGEVLIIVCIAAAYIMRVILQYSRNVNASLLAENDALRQVEHGDLNASVPITSNDEFGHMASLTNRMIAQLRASNDALARTRDATILSLISLSAKRDNETGMHIRRTQTYVALLARALRSRGLHQDVLSDAMIDLLYTSAPLHDIGKVGVPDAILKKPGKLDDAEFAIMKTHAQIGADALAEAEASLGGGSSFLSLAREIAATHHEKWDGSGYPNGLAGTDIPLSGRLMAVADVYDALRSPRVYKPGFSHEKAKAILIEGRGTHFDPDLIDAFLSVEHEIENLAERMADALETPETAVAGDQVR